jgi:HPt (histidine-containing phosphotransfer) domain-containing protein
MSFDQDNDKPRETGPHHLAPAIRIASDTLDMEVLNAFEQLQSGDGSDLIIELIDLYLQDSPERILAIRKASAAADWLLLKRAAHNLKGSSSTLGVRHVAEICEKLEENSGADSADKIEALIQLLEYKFGKARQALTAEHQRRQH